MVISFITDSYFDDIGSIDLWTQEKKEKTKKENEKIKFFYLFLLFFSFLHIDFIYDNLYKYQLEHRGT